MTFSLSRIESAEPSLKDSAQSPAWSRKALPCGDHGEVVLEPACLAGEDERRLGGEFAPRRVRGARGRATWDSGRSRAIATSRGVPVICGRCHPPSVGAERAGRQSRSRLECVTVRRLGLFGGTFDPPHFGHVAALKAAATTASLRRHRGHRRGRPVPEERDQPGAPGAAATRRWPKPRSRGSSWFGSRTARSAARVPRTRSTPCASCCSSSTPSTSSSAPTSSSTSTHGTSAETLRTLVRVGVVPRPGGSSACARRLGRLRDRDGRPSTFRARSSARSRPGPENLRRIRPGGRLFRCTKVSEARVFGRWQFETST